MISNILEYSGKNILERDGLSRSTKVRIEQRKETQSTRLRQLTRCDMSKRHR